MPHLFDSLPPFLPRFAVLVWLAVIVALLAPRLLPAQAAPMNMAGPLMETRDEVPPEQLPPPIKIAGVGNQHMAITSNAEAQAWFDQGLNLLHDFWDYESARAFEQAVRSDPNCAMCYWGLYRAESFYHGTSQGHSRRALEKAVSLEKHASKQERLYIDADVAEENLGQPPLSKRNPAAIVALRRKLVQKYPNDLHAKILLALQLEDGYDDKGEPRAGQKEALSILQSVIAADPQNSAANHYYIHAVEASAHPELALHSADILGGLAPSSGHMVHMPGHIYYRVGDYASAEKVFDASMHVDESYMRDQHVQVDDDWNYVHNLMYSIANLLEEGKVKRASALSAKLNAARGELDTTLYTTSPRDGMARLKPELPVALRTADWEKLLTLLKSASEPTALQPNLRFLEGQLAQFAAGMQSVETGDLAKAQEASSKFDAELWRMSQQSKDAPGMASMAPTNPTDPLKLQIMPDALIDPLMKSMSVMSLELRASWMTLDKQADAAKKLFAEAEKEEKDLGYREPPYYVRPVGETEAAALMAVGDYADAKVAYQHALAERPKSGFPLYGIALCDERQGNAAAAAKEYSDFLAAWKSADPDLAQLNHARTFVTQRSGSTTAQATPGS
jgi:tetratricopeptide (TPR) repeat protein